MLEYVREGVTVHIHNQSRLACFSVNLPVIMDQQSKKDIHPVFNKGNNESKSLTGRLMLTLIAAINEFEHTNILRRIREMIAIAKREDIYKG